MNWLISAKDGCVITVKVTPRAAKSEIAGAETEWLRARVKAPPVDGKANAALIELLSDVCRVPKRDISVIAGCSARLKRIHIKGVAADAVAKIISSVFLPPVVAN
jgi:uncharacterized protein